MVVSVGCLRGAFGVVGDGGEGRTEGAMIGREDSSEVGMLTAGGFSVGRAWVRSLCAGFVDGGNGLMTLSQLETPSNKTKSGRE